MKNRDGAFWSGPYSVGFDVDECGNATFVVFDPRLNTVVGVHRASDTIDIPCEIIEDKQLPAHEPQEHKP